MKFYRTFYPLFLNLVYWVHQITLQVYAENAC